MVNIGVHALEKPDRHSTAFVKWHAGVRAGRKQTELTTLQYPGRCWHDASKCEVLASPLGIISRVDIAQTQAGCAAGLMSATSNVVHS